MEADESSLATMFVAFQDKRVPIDGDGGVAPSSAVSEGQCAEGQFDRFPKLSVIVRSRYFSIAVYALILLNLITVSARNFPPTVGMTNAFDIIDDVSGFLYLGEAAVKIAVFGPGLAYFRSAWNIFDFLIAVVSLLGFILERSGASGAIGFVGVARIIRLVRLLGVSERIRLLFAMLTNSAKRLLNISMLVVLFLFLVTLLAQEFFESSLSRRCHSVEDALALTAGTRGPINLLEKEGESVCRYSSFPYEIDAIIEDFIAENRAIYNKSLLVSSTEGSEPNSGHDGGANDTSGDSSADAADANSRRRLALFFANATVESLRYALLYENNIDRYGRRGEFLKYIVEHPSLLNDDGGDDVHVPRYRPKKPNATAMTTTAARSRPTSTDAAAPTAATLSEGSEGFSIDSSDSDSNEAATTIDPPEETEKETEEEDNDDGPALLVRDISTGRLAGQYVCPYNSLCIRSRSNEWDKTNFGDTTRTVATLYNVLTMEAWTGLLYPLIESQGVLVAALFFGAIIFIGNFFLLNLTLVVILDAFERSAVLAELVKKSVDETVAPPPQLAPLLPPPQMLDPEALAAQVPLPLTAATTAPSSQTVGMDEAEHSPSAALSPSQHVASAAPLSILRKKSSYGAHTVAASGDHSETVAAGGAVEHPSSAIGINGIACEVVAISNGPIVVASNMNNNAKKKAITFAALPYSDREKWFGHYSKFRAVCEYIYAEIVGTVWFRVLSSLILLFNLMVETTAYAGMGASHENFIAKSNVAVTFFYIAEVVLKFLAYPFPVWRGDAFNVFDAAITLVSAVELLFTRNSTLSILRSMRFLKVVSLSSSLRLTLATLVAAFKGSLPILALVFLLIFLFAVIGMQLFAQRFCGLFYGTPLMAPDDPSRVGTVFCEDVPRTNFDNIAYAFLSVFVVSTGEGWRNIMQATSAATRNDLLSAAFFTAAHFILGYIMVNLFVAIIINSATELKVQQAEAMAREEAAEAAYAAELLLSLEEADAENREEEGEEGDVLENKGLARSVHVAGRAGFGDRGRAVMSTPRRHREPSSAASSTPSANASTASAADAASPAGSRGRGDNPFTRPHSASQGPRQADDVGAYVPVRFGAADGSPTSSAAADAAASSATATVTRNQQIVRRRSLFTSSSDPNSNIGNDGYMLVTTTNRYDSANGRSSSFGKGGQSHSPSSGFFATIRRAAAAGVELVANPEESATAMATGSGGIAASDGRGEGRVLAAHVRRHRAATLTNEGAGGRETEGAAEEEEASVNRSPQQLRRGGLGVSLGGGAVPMLNFAVLRQPSAAAHGGDAKADEDGASQHSRNARRSFGAVGAGAVAQHSSEAAVGSGGGGIIRGVVDGLVGGSGGAAGAGLTIGGGGGVSNVIHSIAEAQRLQRTISRRRSMAKKERQRGGSGGGSSSSMDMIRRRKSRGATASSTTGGVASVTSSTLSLAAARNSGSTAGVGEGAEATGGEVGGGESEEAIAPLSVRSVSTDGSGSHSGSSAALYSRSDSSSSSSSSTSSNDSDATFSSETRLLLRDSSTASLAEGAWGTDPNDAQQQQITYSPVEGRPVVVGRPTSSAAVASAPPAHGAAAGFRDSGKSSAPTSPAAKGDKEEESTALPPISYSRLLRQLCAWLCLSPFLFLCVVLSTTAGIVFQILWRPLTAPDHAVNSAGRVIDIVIMSVYFIEAVAKMGYYGVGLPQWLSAVWSFVTCSARRNRNSSAKNNKNNSSTNKNEGWCQWAANALCCCCPRRSTSPPPHQQTSEPLLEGSAVINLASSHSSSSSSPSRRRVGATSNAEGEEMAPIADATKRRKGEATKKSDEKKKKKKTDRRVLSRHEQLAGRKSRNPLIRCLSAIPLPSRKSYSYFASKWQWLEFFCLLAAIATVAAAEVRSGITDGHCSSVGVVADSSSSSSASSSFENTNCVEYSMSPPLFTFSSLAAARAAHRALWHVVAWARLLRNLRLWSFVRLSSAAYVLFKALLRSLTTLRNAAVITALFWYMYSVLGLMLFRGKLNACTTFAIIPASEAAALNSGGGGGADYFWRNVSRADISPVHPPWWYGSSSGDGGVVGSGVGLGMGSMGTASYGYGLSFSPYTASASASSARFTFSTAVSSSAFSSSVSATEYNTTGNVYGEFAVGRHGDWGDASFGPLQLTTKAACLAAGHLWLPHPLFNFDNIGNAMLTMFQEATMSDWLTLMVICSDSVSETESPRPNANLIAPFYFITFLILMGQFLVNFIKSALIDGYFSTKGDIEEQYAELRRTKEAAAAERRAARERRRREALERRQRAEARRRWQNAAWAVSTAPAAGTSAAADAGAGTASASGAGGGSGGGSLGSPMLLLRLRQLRARELEAEEAANNKARAEALAMVNSSSSSANTKGRRAADPQWDDEFAGVEDEEEGLLAAEGGGGGGGSLAFSPTAAFAFMRGLRTANATTVASANADDGATTTTAVPLLSVADTFGDGAAGVELAEVVGVEVVAPEGTTSSSAPASSPSPSAQATHVPSIQRTSKASSSDAPQQQPPLFHSISLASQPSLGDYGMLQTNLPASASSFSQQQLAFEQQQRPWWWFSELSARSSNEGSSKYYASSSSHSLGGGHGDVMFAASEIRKAHSSGIGFFGALSNMFGIRKKKKISQFMMLLTAQERYFFQLYRFALYNVRPPLAVAYSKESSPIRFAIRRVVRSRAFELGQCIFAFCHVIAISSMSWPTIDDNVRADSTVYLYRERDATASTSMKAYVALDTACTCVFILIMFAKIAVYGATAYARARRNWVDIAINIVTAAGCVLSIAAPGSVFWTTTRLLLFARVFRIHYLFFVDRGLLVQVQVMFDSARNFIAVLFLIFLLNIAFASAGVILFGRVTYTERTGFQPYAGFESFPVAFATLFRTATGDDWGSLMASAGTTAPNCEPQLANCGNPVVATIYFCLFVLLGSWVALNLFTAVLMEGLVTAESDDQFAIQEDDVRQFQRQWKAMSRRDPMRVALAAEGGVGGELSALVASLNPTALGLQSQFRNFKAAPPLRSNTSKSGATTNGEDAAPSPSSVGCKVELGRQSAGEEEGAPSSVPVASSDSTTSTESAAAHVSAGGGGAISSTRVLMQFTDVPVYAFARRRRPCASSSSSQPPNGRSAEENGATIVIGDTTAGAVPPHLRRPLSPPVGRHPSGTTSPNPEGSSSSTIGDFEFGALRRASAPLPDEASTSPESSSSSSSSAHQSFLSSSAQRSPSEEAVSNTNSTSSFLYYFAFPDDVFDALVCLHHGAPIPQSAERILRHQRVRRFRKDRLKATTAPPLGLWGVGGLGGNNEDGEEGPHLTQQFSSPSESSFDYIGADGSVEELRPWRPVRITNVALLTATVVLQRRWRLIRWRRGKTAGSTPMQ